MRPYRSSSRHIVIGGSPGSGTTLLRRRLDRHPTIACGPEFRVFLPGRIEYGPWAARSGIPGAELRSMVRGSTSQGELIDRFASRYLGARGETRWAEKTPLNVLYFDWVLDRFPDGRVVHVIRDGRDVVCSMADHPDWHWVDGAWKKVMVARPAERYAALWVRDTGAGMRLRGDPRYHEIRYEDLVTNSEETLQRLCGFLGEPWDRVLLEPDAPTEPAGGDAPAADRGPIFDSSIGRWRRDLSPQQSQRVMRVAGPRLHELGYV